MALTTEQFNSIEKESLLEGAKACVANARLHFEAGKLLATDGTYSIANSLLILCSEECIKAMILTAGYFSVKPPGEIDPFFKDHKVKHVEAAKMQSVLKGILKLRGLLKYLKPEKSFLKMLLKGVRLFIAVFSSIDEKEGRQFDAWWKRASSQKNLGFYVDFKKNKWAVPSKRITRKSYEESLKMVQPFMEAVEYIKNIGESDYRIVAAAKKQSQHVN